MIEMLLSRGDTDGRSDSDPFRDTPHAVLAASPGIDPARIETVICIPTFRRPRELAATLDSLLVQDFRRPFAVVIAENDAADRAGATVAARYFTDRLLGLCVLAEQPGNCQAINTAFRTARSVFSAARYFLMVDDDEIASPGWLAAMVAAAEATCADIVGGPVFPKLPAGAPPALARHPAFYPAYETSGPVPMIYGSGNCLITRRVFETLASPDFDLRYNFLGGGDTDFFDRVRRAGLRFHWAAEAVVTETVPEERTRLRWLWKRGLRVGAINYDIERKHARGLAGRLKVTAKSLAILPLALPRGLRLIARRQGAAALHPLAVALGRLWAAFGHETEQYRAPSL